MVHIIFCFIVSQTLVSIETLDTPTFNMYVLFMPFECKQHLLLKKYCQTCPRCHFSIVSLDLDFEVFQGSGSWCVDCVFQGNGLWCVGFFSRGMVCGVSVIFFRGVVRGVSVVFFQRSGMFCVSPQQLFSFIFSIAKFYIY